MDFKIFLFPYRTRILALFFLIVSAICGYFYFLGGKPEFFNIKVFAIISAYLETRYFVFAQTNLLDELAAILFILGIVAFSFSEVKNEKTEYNSFRIKAMYYSIFITLGFWVLSFLFIYGMAIFIVSSFVFIFYFVSYNLVFYFYVSKFKRQKKTQTKS